MVKKDLPRDGFDRPSSKPLMNGDWNQLQISGKKGVGEFTLKGI